MGGCAPHLAVQICIGEIPLAASPLAEENQQVCCLCLMQRRSHQLQDAVENLVPTKRGQAWLSLQPRAADVTPSSGHQDTVLTKKSHSRETIDLTHSVVHN